MKAVGISFPLRISPVTGGIQTAKWDDEDGFGDITIIRQSIFQILGTRFGERMIEKEFGIDMLKLVFDPMDTVTRQQAAHSIIRALSTWEPRIHIRDIEFFEDQDNGAMLLQLKYEVIRTQMQDTISLPL